MATPIIMPKFGMLQTEAKVVRWLRQEGDIVQAGDPLLEVETDKVNMEVESPADGLLARLTVQEGEIVPVTEVIGYVVQAGETLPDHAIEAHRATPLAARVAAAAGVDIAEVPAADAAGRITKADVEAYLARSRATPAARRIARQRQLDLTHVQGSGPHGRIQAADAARAAEHTARPAPDASRFTFDAPPAPAPELIPLRGIRRTIAARMTQSYQTAPHITLTVEADMTAAEALRSELNRFSEGQGGPRVSVTALLVKTCAWALTRHPLVNASLHDETIHLHEEAHVGVAVALDDGLIVPVIHDAGRLGIGDIAQRLDDLSQRARQGRLTPDDVTGGTFTITNLGMFGVKHFTAIINPPEAAILAVGRIVKRAMVDETNDQVRVRPIMEMTLSADHRVLDGAVAARFLADVVAVLEQPTMLLW